MQHPDAAVPAGLGLDDGEGLEEVGQVGEVAGVEAERDALLELATGPVEVPGRDRDLGGPVERRYQHQPDPG